MSVIDNWLKSIIDQGNTEKLCKKVDKKSSPTSSVSEILELSAKFPINFPINTMRCGVIKSKVSKDTLNRNINSAYPIIHEATLVLYQKFLEHKLEFGTDIERNLYANMDVVDLVNRFLTKRAIYFVSANDMWMLINKSSGFGNWESIGTLDETGELTLENCLSYDEIKLSALMSVSSYTYFINDGNRMNDGIPAQNRDDIEKEGIIIGLIGPRLEKAYVMEYQDIVIDPAQNQVSRGYGKNVTSTSAWLFSNFYQKPNWTYEDFTADQKNVPKSKSTFVNVGNKNYFDNLTYSKRLTLSCDTLLLEANERAHKSKKFAYIHVVGIGLGVWAFSEHQTEVFMNTFAERLHSLQSSLHSVSDVHFSYIDSSSCGEYKDGDKMLVQDHPKCGINIHISTREPHVKLVGEDDGKLLVVSYSWDGNAFPGNEFWIGSLHESGNPAAACSTQIPEIHTACINQVVCGLNLRVATKNGLRTIVCYKKEHNTK